MFHLSIFVCEYSCVWVCMCTHMWKPGSALAVVPQMFSTLIFEKVALTGLKELCLSLSLQCWDYKYAPPCPDFCFVLFCFMWMLRTELRSNLCVASILLISWAISLTHTHMLTLTQERQTHRLQRRKAAQTTKAKVGCSVAWAAARPRCLTGMEMQLTQGKGGSLTTAQS